MGTPGTALARFTIIPLVHGEYKIKVLEQVTLFAYLYGNAKLYSQGRWQQILSLFCNQTTV